MPLSTASTTASLPRVTAEAAADPAAHTPSLTLLAALRMPLPTAEAAELTAPTVALVAVPAAFSVAVMPLSTASTTASLPRVTAEAAADPAAHTPSLTLLAALRSDPPADFPISQS